jgi:hypothetical protein
MGECYSESPLRALTSQFPISLYPSRGLDKWSAVRRRSTVSCEVLRVVDISLRVGVAQLTPPFSRSLSMCAHPVSVASWRLLTTWTFPSGKRSYAAGPLFSAGEGPCRYLSDTSVNAVNAFRTRTSGIFQPTTTRAVLTCASCIGRTRDWHTQLMMAPCC